MVVVILGRHEDHGRVEIGRTNFKIMIKPRQGRHKDQSRVQTGKG